MKSAQIYKMLVVTQYNYGICGEPWSLCVSTGDIFLPKCNWWSIFLVCF